MVLKTCKKKKKKTTTDIGKLGQPVSILPRCTCFVKPIPFKRKLKTKIQTKNVCKKKKNKLQNHA